MRDLSVYDVRGPVRGSSFDTVDCARPTLNRTLMHTAHRTEWIRADAPQEEVDAFRAMHALVRDK